MQTRRIRQHVYIDPSQKAALERLTERTRVPSSVYIREGIDLVLAKHKKHIKAR